MNHSEPQNNLINWVIFFFMSSTCICRHLSTFKRKERTQQTYDVTMKRSYNCALKKSSSNLLHIRIGMFFLCRHFISCRHYQAWRSAFNLFSSPSNFTGNKTILYNNISLMKLNCNIVWGNILQSLKKNKKKMTFSRTMFLKIKF